MPSREEVFQAICSERDYQDSRWGSTPELASLSEENLKILVEDETEGN